MHVRTKTNKRIKKIVYEYEKKIYKFIRKSLNWGESMVNGYQ